MSTSHIYFPAYSLGAAFVVESLPHEGKGYGLIAGMGPWVGHGGGLGV